MNTCNGDKSDGSDRHMAVCVCHLRTDKSENATLAELSIRLVALSVCISFH